MIDRRRFVVSGAAVAAAAVCLPAAPAMAAIGDRRMASIARRMLDENSGAILYQDVVGVADFSAPSRDARLHLVNMLSGDVTSYLVAHGRGSDPAHTGWVQQFSNAMGSQASSPGAYLTGQFYNGQHGHSMRLLGLDATNSNAAARAVVVHGAWYVSEDMIGTYGKIGRSEGCFAVAEHQLSEVLSRLGPGRLLCAGKF